MRIAGNFLTCTALALTSCGRQTTSEYGGGWPLPGEPDGVTDSATETDCGGEDDDTDDPAWQCETALVPPCEKPIPGLPLIVAASDFGPGFRFADACSMALLAERVSGDGIEIGVFQRRDDTTPFGPPEIMLAASLVTPAGRARSIAGPLFLDADPNLRHLVLLCHPDGSCEIFGIDEFREPGCDGDHWVEFETEPRHVFGPEAAVRRMIAVGPPGDAVAEIVVVGNGAALITDGGLYGLVAPDTGGTLQGAAGGSMYSFVGDEGRVARWKGYEWTSTEIESGTESDLLAVLGDADGARIASADGRVSRGALEQLTWELIASEPIIDLFDASGTLVAVTESGCIVTDSTDSWFEDPIWGIFDNDAICLAGSLPEPGTRSLYWTCWEPSNLSFLTREGLYGRWDCIHVH